VVLEVLQAVAVDSEADSAVVDFLVVVQVVVGNLLLF
jgi:hypothetical protein